MEKADRALIGFVVCVLVTGAFLQPHVRRRVPPQLYVPTIRSPLGSSVPDHFVWTVRLQDVQRGDRWGMACRTYPDNQPVAQSSGVLPRGTREVALPVSLGARRGVFMLNLYHGRADRATKAEAHAVVTHGPFVAFGDYGQSATWRLGNSRCRARAGLPPAADCGVSALEARVTCGGLPTNGGSNHYQARVHLLLSATEGAPLWLTIPVEPTPQTAAQLATGGLCFPLPYARDAAWGRYLAPEPRTRRLRVDLVRCADGAIVASDEASYAMVLP